MVLDALRSQSAGRRARGWRRCAGHFWEKSKRVSLREFHDRADEYTRRRYDGLCTAPVPAAVEVGGEGGGVSGGMERERRACSSQEPAVAEQQQ